MTNYDPAETQAINFDDLAPSQQQLLTEMLDRYLCSLEKGDPMDPMELATDHPELAEPLANYLESLNFLHGAAVGCQAEALSATAETAELTGGRCQLGDYQIIREVGRGGMGVVYEARDVSLERLVALKVLPFAAVLDRKQIRRFRNEAQAAAQLHHPHIVPVYAVGCDRGIHYFAMQFIEGQPLDSVIDLRKRWQESRIAKQPTKRITDEPTNHASEVHESYALPASDTGATPGSLSFSASNRDYFRTVAQLGGDVAEALHHAHEIGIIHRDIKPSNLMLDDHGKTWVTDFGLARLPTDEGFTRTGEVLGTLRYMSPEQSAGRAEWVDHRSDVYALGVTLYELLTLQPIFAASDRQEFMRAIASTEPISLRKIDPSIPRDLETIVLKAISKSRDDRYTSAQKMADDLSRFLRGESILASRPTPVERLARWAKRRRRLVAVTASITALALVGVTVASLIIAREKTQKERAFDETRQFYQETRDLADQFSMHVADRLLEIPGTESLRRELLLERQKYYESFLQRTNDGSLKPELADTLMRLGKIDEQLDQPVSALALYDRAAVVYEQLIQGDPRNLDYKFRMSVCQNNRGYCLQSLARYGDAKQAYRSATDAQQRLLSLDDDNSRFRKNLAISYSNQASLDQSLEKWPEANRGFELAISLLRESDNSESLLPIAIHNRSIVLAQLAALAREDRPRAEYHTAAVQLCRESLELISQRPVSPNQQFEMATSLDNLAKLQKASGDFSAAYETYGRSIAVGRRLSDGHGTPRFRRQLANSLNNRGQLIVDATQLHADHWPLEQAETDFQQARDILQSVSEESVSSHVQNDLLFAAAGILNNLGLLHANAESWSKANQSYRESLDLLAEIDYAESPQVAKRKTIVLENLLTTSIASDDIAIAQQCSNDLMDYWKNEPKRLAELAKQMAIADAFDQSAELRRCALQILKTAMDRGWRANSSIHEDPAWDRLRTADGVDDLLEQLPDA